MLIVRCSLFNDMLVSNTPYADVMMSTNFVTSASLFWYFLVSAVATSLKLTPAREMVPKGILTGRPMNVLNDSMLDIPEALLSQLEQAFSHISHSQVLEYFSCFFLYSFLMSATLVTSLGPHLGGRIVGPKEPKALFGELDTNCNLSSFLKGVMEMANVDIYPFSDHDKTEVQPDETGETLPLIPGGVGGATWAPECEQET